MTLLDNGFQAGPAPVMYPRRRAPEDFVVPLDAIAEILDRASYDPAFRSGLAAAARVARANAAATPERLADFFAALSRGMIP